MYSIVVPPQAKRELRKIKFSYRSLVSAAFIEIREDPFIGKPLNQELLGQYSFRIGVYRILYKVNRANKTVHIISAGHRSMIYRR